MSQLSQQQKNIIAMLIGTPMSKTQLIKSMGVSKNCIKASAIEYSMDCLVKMGALEKTFRDSRPIIQATEAGLHLLDTNPDPTLATPQKTNLFSLPTYTPPQPFITEITAMVTLPTQV